MAESGSHPQPRRGLAWKLLLLIGLLALALGIVYLLVPQPWLLDRRANERLLGMSYQQLFQQVPTLPDYLIVVYRFFGLYLLAFGALFSFVVLTAFRRGERWAWWAVFPGLGALLALQTYLIAVHIPVSPFLWLDLIVIILWGVALAFSLQRK